MITKSFELFFEKLRKFYVLQNTKIRTSMHRKNYFQSPTILAAHTHFDKPLCTCTRFNQSIFESLPIEAAIFWNPVFTTTADIRNGTAARTVNYPKAIYALFVKKFHEFDSAATTTAVMFSFLFTCLELSQSGSITSAAIS